MIRFPRRCRPWARVCLCLVLLNYPYRFVDGYAPHQSSAWLLLAWGGFLKRFSSSGLRAAILTTLVLVIAGLVEARENRAFFGAAYR